MVTGSESKDTTIQTTQNETEREKNKQTTNDPNIHVIGVPERE